MIETKVAAMVDLRTIKGIWELSVRKSMWFSRSIKKRLRSNFEALQKLIVINARINGRVNRRDLRMLLEMPKRHYQQQ